MLHNSETCPGRTVLVDGQEFLFFSGTSYLGMSSNQEFHKKIFKGFEKYGSNYPMSRISNIRLKIYDEFESWLSAFLNTEDTITLSSGFLAGRLLIEYFQTNGNLLFAPNTHPAIKEINRTTDTSDFKVWVEKSVETINKSKNTEWVIFTDSMSPLYTEVYSFDWLSDINSCKNVTVIIDDSHGLGIIGSKNRGITDLLNNYNNVEYIVMASLGKAFGVPGGVISGTKDTISQLRNTPFFSACSPIIPAYIYAFMTTAELRDIEIKKLISNLNFMKSKFEKYDSFVFDEYFPVFRTHYHSLFDYCFKRGIFISSFSYPTSEDEKFTRIVLNSRHTMDDLTLLSATIDEFFLFLNRT